GAPEARGRRHRPAPHSRRRLRRHQASTGGDARRSRGGGAPGSASPCDREGILMRLFSVLFLLSGSAVAAPAVPKAQIPPSVLAELHLLENHFELALAMDCAPERCFAKGCTYVEHAVADKPRSASLPGLAEEQGPGSVAAQEYLTLARCSFAHEKSIGA